jgi:deoxyribonuclease-4
MIGFHVSLNNKSFKDAIEINHKLYKINAVQIFIRNPRQSKIIKINDKKADDCNKYITENNIFLVSHACYIINSSSKKNWDHNIESSLNELIYSEKIGALGSVFHVGKHLKLPIEEGENNMFEFISIIIEKLQSSEINCKSIYILETSAGQGTELLSNITNLGIFYNRFSEKQKESLRICIDTCHVFSAGYDLQSKEYAQDFIDLVQQSIDWKYVTLLHLNDSVKACNCRVDRHHNLGEGFISKDDENGLKLLTKHCALNKIPIILETPHDHFKRVAELKKVNEWITI